MKSKKLLFSTLLMLGGIATYTFLGSNSTGQMGISTSGCSCHGNANQATAIAIEGIPTSGFVPGTAYPLTLKVTNSTKVKAGFDMSVSTGTMSNAPSGTMLMGGTELHHTTPGTAASGVTTWAFTWTAPATGGSVNFNIAALAADGLNGNSGDHPNNVSLTFNKATPASVSNFNTESFSLYPNPANELINFKSIAALTDVQFTVYSINGTSHRVQVSKLNDKEYAISTAHLSVGNYILVATQQGKQAVQTFSKQ